MQGLVFSCVELLRCMLVMS